MGKGPVSKQTRGLPPLVRALAFGCILLALLLCTQEVLAPKRRVHRRLFMPEPEDTIDVIFLGSSHANAAFAPAQMWRSRVSTGVCIVLLEPADVGETTITQWRRSSGRRPGSWCWRVRAVLWHHLYDACGRGRHLGRLFAAHPPSLNRAALAVAMSRCQQTRLRFTAICRCCATTRGRNLTAEDFTWFSDHATTGKATALQTVENSRAHTGREPEKRPSIPG